MDCKNKLYFIVNSDIEISSGKLAGQVSHATTTFVLNNHYSDEFNTWYNNGLTQTKIILKGSQKLLEELEQEGYICIRDNGLTELPPNTLTCCCLGLGDKEYFEGKIKGFKRLRLY